MVLCFSGPSSSYLISNKFPPYVNLFISIFTCDIPLGVSDTNKPITASLNMTIFIRQWSLCVYWSNTFWPQLGKIQPLLFFVPCSNSPQQAKASHYPEIIIVLRHTTLGRIPLDKRSARRRDLYLTTHKTHNRQTSTPTVRFEPTIPESEKQQTFGLLNNLRSMLS